MSNDVKPVDLVAIRKRNTEPSSAIRQFMVPWMNAPADATQRDVTAMADEIERLREALTRTVEAMASLDCGPFYDAIRQRALDVLPPR